MSIPIRIIANSNLTIAEQICQQIELAIASGELEEGKKMPSVRQLAVELKVNPNTVAGALQSLVSSGSLNSQKGKGYFVAAKTTRLSDSERQRQLQEAAKQFVASTRPLSLSNQELTKAILDLLPKGEGNDNE